MLVEGIKSRPVYTTLAPRPGRLHLLVHDAAGAPAVEALLAAADAAFVERTRRFPATAAGGEDAAIAGLAGTLADARMGTQVYVAGTEHLIARVVEVGLAAGLELGAIMAEHRGSHERRVQCVHCKTVLDHVTTQPVRCTGCGLTLLVRDHYSRRIGAFQGVCIDAEEPGVVPETEALFA